VSSARGVREPTVLAESWPIHLQASNLADPHHPCDTKDEALFAAFLGDQGDPTAIRSTYREHVDAFMRRRWRGLSGRPQRKATARYGSS
jgi:hypothetical protein